MKITDLNLKEIIERARKAGACKTQLSVIGEFKDVKDLLEKASGRKKAFWAFWYARDVIKGRWPEAEDVIAENAEYAYGYAKDVLKGRWPEAEDVIARDANYAWLYARYVIKGRWPEAEDVMAKNAEYA